MVVPSPTINVHVPVSMAERMATTVLMDTLRWLSRQGPMGSSRAVATTLTMAASAPIAKTRYIHSKIQSQPASIMRCPLVERVDEAASDILFSDTAS
jgi:hypothetical protein